MLLKNADKQMVDNEGYRALDHLDDFEDEQEDEEEGAVGIKVFSISLKKRQGHGYDRAKFMAEFRAMLSVLWTRGFRAEAWASGALIHTVIYLFCTKDIPTIFSTTK